MRLFRLLLAIFATIGLLAAGAHPAFALSSQERETTFWKVAVIDFSGRSPSVDGATAGVRFAASLRNSKRFHVIDPQTVRKGVRKAEIAAGSGRLSESDAKKICRELRIDGIFTGRIAKAPGGGGALTIALYSASGKLFAQYRFPMTARFPLAEASRVAAAFTQRLPYDGLVVSVRRDLALINLGTTNGLANGSKVYAFEFEGNAGANGGARRALAELEVVRAEQHGAWVRPLRGDVPEEYTKISLRPVAGAAELKPPSKTVETATPYVELEADVDMAFLFKSYELSGTDATSGQPQRFTSNTTLFPAPGLHVLYFPTPSIGGEFTLRHGFIPFRRPPSPGQTKTQTYQGSLDQVMLEAELRKTFGGSGRLAGGSASIGAGLDYMGFKIQSQNPLVLTNDTYIGPIVSGALRLPISDPLSLRSGIGVVPFATVSQSPQNNGSGSVFGLHGTLGLDYHINDRLFMALDYGIDQVSAKFPSGGGSRNVQNAKSSDLYHGVTLTFGWRRYK